MVQNQKSYGPPRESWGSRIGVILAVAGSAVGLGNFLRFPGVAVQNGGGAFLIPYFISFLLLGIPICWVEWTIGRRAGRLGGLSSSPGIFGMLGGGGPVKYVGALGLFIPIVIYMYYVYIESWCLAYAWFSLKGDLILGEGGKHAAFFSQFTSGDQYFDALPETLTTLLPQNFFFFILTFFINFFLIFRGLSRGIERFCKWAMPLLIFSAIFIVIRVLLLGTPDPAHPDQNVVNGLGYMWNPNWSELANPNVWLAACGQIFFSLSVGFGIILTYSSYLTKKDDVVLSGLTASSMNEFCEVCLGGMIIIPAAFIFLGVSQMEGIAKAGTFSIGFVVLPQIFELMPLGQGCGTLFYFLLFLAGITSSISMLQPAIAFIEEGFHVRRSTSMAILGLITLMGTTVVILSPGFTVLGTLDEYASNLGIPLLALFEVIVFIFVIKVKDGVEEAHVGADMRLPRWFPFVITYITPVFLLVILGSWLWSKIHPFFSGGVTVFADPIQSGTILAMVGFFVILVFLVKAAWPRMAKGMQQKQ